ncbi:MULTISPECIES: hypothetical protein [Streptomyces]|uniref:Uncharacterized protein n=1 Tax=Streptomyces coelicolor (strain ATCC BAA-471 / A3(2) / M145) TaxID=100226 RepID=Q9L1W4_STRCO|nr:MULTISPECIES: hypothetical protein [Streptomyces]MDX2929231.1 hypothetical protein [Streptomyces sp. NRRL_B-16638]MYU46352.1 hypothetical protein [Streptomyces sp. SID7813]QFI46627.1 hypothetical protein FQ762_35320 [Streptomyces coelicolor A3(2)]TYP13982.1 hypothetical protein FHV91_102442 [Streptomyces coelicolor]TYP17407.1 hypothetical protein FHV98_10262 [Streptomyces coelicolor A3(2)]
MTEHTRLLGEVVPALEELSAEAARIRDGEIAKPVREITPLSLRVHELAMKCTRQVHDLSVSQYPAMKDGTENLALLAGACSQISLAATLCNFAIHHRTEILLYEDADPTPATSRDQLRRTSEELQRAAATYRTVSRRLSRRLASFSARAEDRRATYRTVSRRLSRRLASFSARAEDRQLIAQAQGPSPQKATSAPPAPRHTGSPKR